MQKLEEGMLPIGPDFTPDNGIGRAGQGLPIAVDGLAVRFHFQLLQIAWQMTQGFVIGDDGRGVRAEEICIPDAQQSQQHR